MILFLPIPSQVILTVWPQENILFIWLSWAFILCRYCLLFFNGGTSPGMSELTQRECEMAVAGGVNVMITPKIYFKLFPIENSVS
jgi:hypothetical protein